MADPYSPKKADTGTPDRLTAFWPFTLLALSLCAILVWQLIVANQVKNHAEQLLKQQEKVVSQAHQVQTGLQKFARDLIEVAKSDAEAKAIIDKYGISVTNPAATAPAAQASP
jgi:hypothetical protein